MDWCVQLSGFLGMSVYNPLYFAAMSHCQDWHPVFLGPSGPANPAKNGTAQTSQKVRDFFGSLCIVIMGRCPHEKTKKLESTLSKQKL